MPTSSQDPLPSLLSSWRVTPRRDPSFRALVARRIQAAAQPSTWARFARAHAPLVSTLLMAALVAGGWTGMARAEARGEAARTAIATSYVNSLDARMMRH